MTSKGVFICRKDRKDVRLYHLTNGVISADILNVGGAIVKLMVPDKNGVLADVMLGFKTLEEYTWNRASFGSLVGRYANRIGNAHFEINGKGYDLVRNNGKDGPVVSLHGGPKSWGIDVWDVVEEETDERHLTLTLHSPDRENGFPGNVDVKMVYSITDNNGLSLEYFAKSDQDTYVNLTNHSYFNMAGHDSGTCLDHIMTINADHYLPTDENWIPTGEIRPVKGTPFDFTSPKPIGQDIGADDEDLIKGNGYDHNFCLNGEGMRLCAIVEDPKEGRVMTVYTDKPGVQLYTANGLAGAFVDSFGKDGARYGNRDGYCLETQLYPDTPNKPNFPNGLLKAGEEYHYTTIYEFSAK